MPQFSPTSLSRLLRNVDRVVLEKAVTQADLWDLFGSFERAALIELGEAQNLAANIETFGLDEVEPEGWDSDDVVEMVMVSIPLLPKRFQPMALIVVGLFVAMRTLGVDFTSMAKDVLALAEVKDVQITNREISHDLFGAYRTLDYVYSQVTSWTLEREDWSDRRKAANDIEAVLLVLERHAKTLA